jgi:hypothetical protein
MDFEPVPIAILVVLVEFVLLKFNASTAVLMPGIAVFVAHRIQSSMFTANVVG